jgi:hypothetical protein
MRGNDSSFCSSVEASYECNAFFVLCNLQIKAIIQPGLGLYTIVMAQRILRVSSRFMLDCHKTILYDATEDASSSRPMTIAEDQSWEDIEDSLDESSTASSRDSSDERSVTIISCYGHSLEDFDATIGASSSEQAQPIIVVEAQSTENIEATIKESSTELPVTENDEHSLEQSEAQSEAMRNNKARRVRTVDGKSHASNNGEEPIDFVTVFAAITVLLIGMIGAFLAPAISIDFKAVWGIIGTGHTFAQAVKDLPVFRVITEILLQSRVVLDSVSDYIGLGFLLIMVITVAAAFPVMEVIERLRKLKHQPRQIAEIDESSSESLGAAIVRTASIGLEKAKTELHRIHSNWSTRREGCGKSGDIDLRPLYGVKGWQHMHVYISAFVAACWQLGAVAAYTIHLYCYFAEMIFKSLERLGLVESSTTECFYVQVTKKSTVAIICTGFVVLLISFLLQGASHYRDVTARYKTSFQ